MFLKIPRSPGEMSGYRANVRSRPILCSMPCSWPRAVQSVAVCAQTTPREAWRTWWAYSARPPSRKLKAWPPRTQSEAVLHFSFKVRLVRMRLPTGPVITHVQMLSAWNSSPLQSSKLSCEYLLLPPRSAPETGSIGSTTQPASQYPSPPSQCWQ